MTQEHNGKNTPTDVKNQFPSHSLWNRMLRAAKLEAAFYSEINLDNTATAQAFKAVLVSSTSTGIGYGISVVIKDGLAWLSWGLILGVALAVVNWILWSFIVYLVGTRLFRTSNATITCRGILRATGFANSPAAVGILAFVPFLGPVALLATFVWPLISTVIGVRVALETTTWHAIATCVISWIIYVLVIVAPVLALYTVAKLA